VTSRLTPSNLSNPSNRTKQRGIALIQVIITTSIIMLLAVFFLTSASGQVKRAQALQNKTKAYLSYYTAKNQVLYQLLTTGYPELQQRNWNFHGAPIKINEHTTVAIQDLNGLLSLPSMTRQYVLKRTLTPRLGENEANRVADSIMDWIDKDSIAKRNGAEQPAYAGTGITVRNGPIQTYTEFAYINAMSVAAEEVLLENTTIHPTPFFNPMTSPQTLLGAYLDDEGIAESAIGMRGGAAYNKAAVQSVTKTYPDEGLNFFMGPGFRLTINSKVADSFYGKVLEYEIYPYRPRPIEVLSRLPRQQTAR
jgi:general secretion pathway protein K